MSQVTITISGPPGSGRSTLAQLIADRLRVMRIPVAHHRPDFDAEVSSRVQLERLDALAERLTTTGASVQIIQKRKEKP